MSGTYGSETLERALRNPGRLVLGPTSTSAFPYGGDVLGFHKDAEIVWHSDLIQTRDPFSGRVSEIGRRGADFPEIYCLLEGPSWDLDALTGIFSRYTLTGSPQEARLEGTIIPLGVHAWPPILFAPDNPSHKAVYFRRPIPTLSLRTAVAISEAKECGLPIRFVPSPDSSWASGGDWQICRVENLTL